MAKQPKLPPTWAPLDPQTATVLEHILRQVPIDGVSELADQLPGATAWEHHEGQWAVRAERVLQPRVRDGALPIRALVVGEDADDPVGEVVVWVMNGRLSGFEYLRFNDQAPRGLPPPDAIQVRLRGADWTSDGIDWRDDSFDDELARAWLADTHRSEENPDVAQRVWELTHEDLDPRRGWRLVKRLIESSEGRELWYVGRGPLASMVENHLQLIEDDLVTSYRTNPRYPRAFEGQMSMALHRFKERFGRGYWGWVTPAESLDQIREIVELLAAPADEQIAWLDGAKVPIDELVLQFRDSVPGWLTRLRDEADLELEAERALLNLLADVDSMPSDPDVWTAEGMRSSPVWEVIRAAAASAVRLLPRASAPQSDQ